MIKLHKRQCMIKLVGRDDTKDYAIYLLGNTFGGMSIPTWELVALWYQIGELIGFDHDDAKHELEMLHWKHEQGEIDEKQRTIKNRKSKHHRWGKLKETAVCKKCRGNGRFKKNRRFLICETCEGFGIVYVK